MLESNSHLPLRSYQRPMSEVSSQTVNYLPGSPLSFQQTCRCCIRPFGEFKLRERIIPLPLKQAFRQALLIHPQIICIYALDLVTHIFQQCLICPVTHIAECHICPELSPTSIISMISAGCRILLLIIAVLYTIVSTKPSLDPRSDLSLSGSSTFLAGYVLQSITIHARYPSINTHVSPTADFSISDQNRT